MNSKIHFNPSKGWMNDPNGLIKINDTYHIFFQHYPNDTVWGPMHWGHAVSKDLVSWEELPVAIYPDDELYIFSGSCMLDTHNVSGLGTHKAPALLAFYTSHSKTSGQQQQCIAYSTDYITFTKYSGNPVIPNTVLPDFRDPKVFSNPIRGGYSMVVAAGRYIFFYHSFNLLDWNKTGEFKFSDYGYSGIVECPDCFLLNNGLQQKWLLSASIVVPDDEPFKTVGDEITNITPHFTQYFTGTFDGDTFIVDSSYHNTKLLDYGTDNYATVTFANCNDKIIMGWGDNWKYINDTEDRVHKGKLTIARKLMLVSSGDDFYIAQEPMLPVTCAYTFKTTDRHIHLLSSTVKICITHEELHSIRFTNSCGNFFDIIFSEDSIWVDRSFSDNKSFSVEYASERYSKKRAKRRDLNCKETTIILDNGYFEIFTDNGISNFSMNTYPDEPFSDIIINGRASIEISNF